MWAIIVICLGYMLWSGRDRPTEGARKSYVNESNFTVPAGVPDHSADEDKPPPVGNIRIEH